MKQGGNRLRACIFPLKGYVEWWAQRVPAKSFNIAFSEVLGGVHLEKPHTSGQFRGSFRFPKRGSYRFELFVRLQSLDEQDEASSDAPAVDGVEDVSDATRDLKFYIGSDFDALQEFTFRDPGGQVRRSGGLFCLSALLTSVSPGAANWNASIRVLWQPALLLLRVESSQRARVEREAPIRCRPRRYLRRAN